VQGVITPVDLSSFVPAGYVNGVAINPSRMAIVGGQYLTGLQPPFACLISSKGKITELDLSSIKAGAIMDVAINHSGAGIIGGAANTSSIAFLVSEKGSLKPLSVPKGTVYSVSINNSGIGLIGGQGVGKEPFAFLSSAKGHLTNLHISSLLPGEGFLFSVSINDAGQGLLGGGSRTGEGPPEAFRLTSSGSLKNLNLSSLFADGYINSVAINAYGQGILGGQRRSGTEPPIALLVSAKGDLKELTIPPVAGQSYIYSVAINNSGVALMGGQNNTTPQAPIGFLVSPSGAVTDLQLSSYVAEGYINSVAINEFGAGLLGGQGTDSGQAPVAFLLSPSGQLMRLNLSVEGLNNPLYSVSILSQIPTSGLRGNNLTLADYINDNAPYDAFYFVPAYAEDALSQALESVAPTRNALPMIAADNNLFFLNQSFSRHTQDTRRIRQDREHKRLARAQMAQFDEHELTASLAPTMTRAQSEESPSCLLWGEVLGMAAYQKAQHQTPAFRPVSGGIILGLEGELAKQGYLGGGAAYTYTHIHDKQGAGHNTINQEYLFLYGLWSTPSVYLDVALWGGMLQSENVRKIHIPGFEYRSRSHLHGWQLSPHAELGYDCGMWKRLFVLEPFVMFDWINNWQHHYRERGNGPFNMRQKSHSSSFLRSELGMRFYETIHFDTWRLILQEMVGYVNKKPFQVGSVTAALVGAPGSFTVDTLTTTQNLASVAMQLLFAPIRACYPSGAVAYQGEFGSRYQAHQLSLNVLWNF
jgi:outer membrane autotransporter protein